MANTTTMHTLSGIYGGEFEDAMNRLYSKDNIAATAQKITELEKTHGPFEVGKFNRYLLVGLEGVNFDKFEADFGLIPDMVRQRVTDVMRANFQSANPLPLFTQVSENVEPVHDVIIKPFVYNDQLYIGVLYLCPNTKTPI